MKIVMLLNILLFTISYGNYFDFSENNLTEFNSSFWEIKLKQREYESNKEYKSVIDEFNEENIFKSNSIKILEYDKELYELKFRVDINKKKYNFQIEKLSKKRGTNIEELNSSEIRFSFKFDNKKLNLNPIKIQLKSANSFYEYNRTIKENFYELKEDRLAYIVSRVGKTVHFNMNEFNVTDSKSFISYLDELNKTLKLNLRDLEKRYNLKFLDSNITKIEGIEEEYFKKFVENGTITLSLDKKNNELNLTNIKCNVEGNSSSLCEIENKSSNKSSAVFEKIKTFLYTTIAIVGLIFLVVITILIRIYIKTLRGEV